MVPKVGINGFGRIGRIVSAPLGSPNRLFEALRDIEAHADFGLQVFRNA